VRLGRLPRIGLWLGFVLICVGIVSRAQFSADLSTFLPRSPSPAQQILVEQLRNGLVSRLILVGLEGAPPETLAALSKDITARLRQAPDFIAVNDGADLGLAKDRDYLWQNRYLLSPTVNPARFTAGGLHAALTDDVQLLGSSMGALVKQTLPNDPTGEMLGLIRQLQGEAHPLTQDGVWFSPDGNRALLLMQTQAPGFDADAQQHDLALIDGALQSAKAATPGAGQARLLATGPGVFSVNTRDTVKADASRLSIFATLAVAGLLLLVYRSPTVLVLALLPVATGAVAGIAAVSLGFGSVHGITLGFGVTLIGEAVDYAIYLFTQTAPGSPPEATLPRIWPTLRLGVLTSVCGFSAMLLSSFRGLAQLGLFSIVGLIVAVGVTRFVLPALMRRDFATSRSTRFGPAILRAAARAKALRWPLLAVAALAAVFLVYRHDSLWDDELSSLSPVSQADQALDRQLRGDLGAPDVRYMAVVEAPDEQQALAASERLGTELQALIGDGVLAGFDAASRYLPSESAQRARQQSIPPPDTLRANLARALEGLPFQPDIFAPFLKDAAAARSQPLLTRDSLHGTNLASKLDALLLRRTDGWAAMLPLRGVADPARLQAALAGQAGVLLLDLKGDSDALYQGYRRQALLLGLLGALGIVALLFISFRSPRRVAEVVAPLVAAVIVATAILAAGGARLTLFNLVGLLLVVGVGSNYALFFESQGASHQAAGPQHRERVIASLVLADLCTVIGFGVLTFSRIPVLHGIGLTVALGAVLSLVFSAILSAPPAPPIGHGGARAKRLSRARHRG
jgi:predicted exporter